MAAVLLSPVSAAPALADAGSDAGASASSPLSPAGATAQAAATGSPVVVDSLTTETSQTVANPDGTFTVTSTDTPVRTLQDGEWTPIDTSLTRNPDGTLSPAAATDQVAFSGGGDTPLVQLSQGATSVSFSWPTPLPAPVVDGATATYLSVLPGVDLKLTAAASSYNEVLVVHNAASAANPALAHLRFTATATGLQLARDPRGGLTATDASGAIIFHGSAPIMWDSASDIQVGEAPDSTNPGSGDVSKLTLSMPTADADATPDTDASTTLTLTPPTQALTGSDVTYPIYIDPTMSPAYSNFAEVFNNGWHYYNDTSNDLQVGYCGWSNCGGIYGAVGRSYFSFDTNAISNQATTGHIYSAEVDAYEVHNSSECDSQPVDLYSSASISSSTTWPGPINNYLDETSSNRGDTCKSDPNAKSGEVQFSSTALTNYVQSAANGDWGQLTFALRAPSESDTNQWKRFSSTKSASSGVALVVKYDFPPSPPTGLKVANSVACSGKPVYVRDATPTLYGQATDNDPTPLWVYLHFAIYNSDGTSVSRYSPNGVQANSGQLVSWTNTSSNTNSNSPLSDAAYEYHVYAESGSPDTENQTSAESNWYPFTIDTTAPTTPAVQSFAYPDGANAGAWGSPQNSPGTITLSGSSNTSGFAYSFDGANVLLPVDTQCSYNQAPTTTGGMTTASSGQATITPPTSLAVGYHSLSVQAFDAAHNVSSLSTRYVFYVAPTVPGETNSYHETENYQVSGQQAHPCQLPVPNPTDNPAASTFVETGTTTWSGSSETRLVAACGDPNNPAQFTMPFTVGVEADYALGIQVSKANHYGIVAFEIDGKPIFLNGARLQIDTYSAAAATAWDQLGGAHLATGAHTLTVDIIGTNTSSTSTTYTGTPGASGTPDPPATYDHFADNGYSAGIDYIRVTAINNVTTDNFADAMNNKAIAVDGTTSADINPSNGHAGLSSAALAAVGIRAGQTYTPSDGTNVTFTIPTAHNGNDNVIAAGQTIPFPAPVYANYVDLLVLSTCGPTSTSATPNPQISLSINYHDPNPPAGQDPNLKYTRDVLPIVPDWGTNSSITDPAITLAVTMPYRDYGTAKDTTVTPRIYHLHMRVSDTSKQVRSVVLPYLGTTFTESCTTPALHVLALTTS